MSELTKGKNYSFDRSRIYCISIIGLLDKIWSDRFEGMSITTRNRDDFGQVTSLVGTVPDQAALSGILETLYEAHYTLLSVEML